MQLLRRVTTPDGILASPVPTENYRRVWARDSIMCGLAGLVAGSDRVTEGLRTTLDTLAGAEGPDGQIPSNVSVRNGEVTDVSYGGLSGRVDAIPWFIIGLAHYVETTGDTDLRDRYAEVVQRGLQLMAAWEYNRRGLVYVPLGGDWADEYALHGYVLFDQLMRIWALRCARRLGWADAARRLPEIEDRVAVTFRLDTGGASADATYHPEAARQLLDSNRVPAHWLPALSPGGYQTPFDAWSNALAVLLGLGDAAVARRTLDAGESIRAERPLRVIPAFWPPIQKGDADWPLLEGNHRGRFQNMPGRYHNGGLWPMVNGWWGCALADAGRRDDALDVLAQTHEANRRQSGDPEREGHMSSGEWSSGEWLFPEYRDAETGAPGGTYPLAWSAAGTVLLHYHGSGQPLRYH